MGRLVDGVWRDEWYDTEKSGGRFERAASVFRDWIGTGGFKAEAGRYHLYVSHACPWAHRTLIFRQLKKLEEMISVTAVEPLMLEGGWTFAGNEPVNDCHYLYQVYLKARAGFSGRVTVPVLWDKQGGTIVNNESAEIIRMFNSAFDSLGAGEGDYYPEELRGEIDAVNETVYETVNNGVYRAGFATTQEAYEEAYEALFETLDMVESRLARQPYLAGRRLSEADWRLFTTLVRFDSVYYGHFKCNKRRIVDYPNLWSYLRQLYQTPGIAGTVNMDHIKNHYYASHRTVNPTGIVPVGPELDFTAAHDRDRF